MENTKTKQFINFFLMKKKTSNIGMCIYNNVKQFRESLGWTQGHLAKKSDCSRGMITHLENHSSRPSVEVASRITKALGRTLEEVWYLDFTHLSQGL